MSDRIAPQKAPQAARKQMLAQAENEQPGRVLKAPPFKLLAGPANRNGQNGGPNKKGAPKKAEKKDGKEKENGEKENEEKNKVQYRYELINYNALADRIKDAYDPETKEFNAAEVIGIINQMQGKNANLLKLRNAFNRRFPEIEDGNLLKYVQKVSSGEEWKTLGKVFREHKKEYKQPEVADGVKGLKKHLIEQPNFLKVVELLLPYRSKTIKLRKAFAEKHEITKGKDKRRFLYSQLYKQFGKDPAQRNLLEVLLGNRKPNELVTVGSKAEAMKMTQLMYEIYERFGVELNSNRTLSEFSRYYVEKGTPIGKMTELRTVPWKGNELKILKKALTNFENVDHEHQAGIGLQAVGRLNHALRGDSNNFGTMGIMSRADRSLGIYSSSKSKATTYRIKGEDKKFEAVLNHELGHLHFDKIKKWWAEQTKFWEPKYEKGEDGTLVCKYNHSKNKNAEAPISPYGASDIREDIAESFSYYFTYRQGLKNGIGPQKEGEKEVIPSAGEVGNPCPDRLRLIKKLLKTYSKEDQGGRK